MQLEMDQQDVQGLAPQLPGPAGRRLHIAHRRSPSELTPLMSKPYLPSPSTVSHTCLLRPLNDHNMLTLGGI